MVKETKHNSGGLLFHQVKELDRLSLLSESYNVPNYIKSNVKNTLRYYQEESLRYLHYVQKSPNAHSQYNHLLFHMATGAGKTMVMAATILYMYKEYGYQNFIFFVHTDAIVQKTKENLLHTLSPKYLFTSAIEINGESICIEAVDTFPSTPNANTIYLKISTIHKIHDELNHHKENSITYDDLKELKLVLLGDEAHHFNAGTKAKGKAKTSFEYKELTWEKTIDTILALKPENRLFEFTATINLENKEIYQKYKDKIIYQYDLKQFMTDGFSKKVMLLEANQNDSEKMLDAVLLSQYRKMVALDNGITGFKPIILFKSNTIAISKSKQDEFIQIISNLTPTSVRRHLKNKKTHIFSPTSIWNKVISSYSQENLPEIIATIKDDFTAMNILNVNKNDVIEEHPILLNTLEQRNNPIRAVFAVAKVNEGWDVLNLYDIVRISEKSSQTKSSTDSEAQLIGRGARYYPFCYQGKISYRRRFDTSAKDLSILEQLHYHTINDPAYIKTLHISLDHANIVTDTDGKGIIHNIKLKKSFTASDVYKRGKLYFNKTEKITNEQRSWESYSLETNFEVKHDVLKEKSLDTLSEASLRNKFDENDDIPYHTEVLRVDKRFFLKAMAKQTFYRFNTLQRYFPSLQSLEEFITSDKFLKKITIDILLPKGVSVQALSAKDKLDYLERVLTKISENIRRNYQKYRGTYEFVSVPLKNIIKDYSLYIDPSKIEGQKITEKSMLGKKWHVFDNAIVNQLEHKLIELLDRFIAKLSEEYTDIYLIRNDENSTRFKLTEFNGVRGFMPDFILLMKEKNSEQKQDVYYQVFLEPKGDHLLAKEKWKESMLKEINNNQKITFIDAEENIQLVGIKFFADSQREAFIKDFEEKIYKGKSLRESSLLLE